MTSVRVDMEYGGQCEPFCNEWAFYKCIREWQYALLEEFWLGDCLKCLHFSHFSQIFCKQGESLYQALDIRLSAPSISLSQNVATKGKMDRFCLIKNVSTRWDFFFFLQQANSLLRTICSIIKLWGRNCRTDLYFKTLSKQWLIGSSMTFSLRVREMTQKAELSKLSKHCL